MGRELLQEKLNEIRNDILHMGTLAQGAIDLAMTALVRQDADLAEKVVMDDAVLDRLELEVESKCLSLLALQQPMARDLRFVGTALKINTELERIGDYAVNIAKVVLALHDEPLIKPLEDLPRMAEIAQEMIRENLTAYVNGDREAALNAARNDYYIDRLYEQVFKDLLGLMLDDPRNIKQAMHLLLVSRALERIGDHITNVSEWIIYMVTGERLRLNE